MSTRAPSAGPPADAGPVVDPRFERRRLEVRRDAGRRRLTVVLASAAVVAAVAGGLASTRSPVLDVDRVEVRGASHTSRADVVSVTGLGSHRRMVDVRPGAVARAVERLPWVAHARVIRQWPATVRIDLQERVPVAVVAVGGPAAPGSGLLAPADRRWALADRTGRVLAVVPRSPTGLPELAGVAAPGGPGASVVAAAGASLPVAAALPPGLRPRVAEVAAADGGAVRLRLGAPGAVVLLGPPDRLAEKLAAVQAVLDGASLDRLAVIDVRVPAAPVLTRR